MATVVHEHFETAPSLEGFRVSWAGIWGGVLTVMGILLFLTTLGLAVGITAIEPGRTEAGALGTGAAIWSGISLLIALFVGGWAATRLGMVFDKAAGAFEGALVWVLSFLVILWLASAGVKLVASGISGLFSGVTQTISTAATGLENLSAGDVDQILNRLRNPQTASTISRATGIPEQDVSTRLNNIAQRVEAARNNPQQAAAEVRQGTADMIARAREQLPAAAQQVQAGASKTAWITFGAMVISLLAAIAGAMVGRGRVVARLDEAAVRGSAVTR